jgi:hypothetical protein
MKIEQLISDVNSRYKDDIGRKEVNCIHQGFLYNSLLGIGRYTCVLLPDGNDNCIIKKDCSECDNYKPKKEEITNGKELW